MNRTSMQSELETVKNNPALKNTLDEIRKTDEAMLRWANLKREKVLHYQKKLSQLSAAEKKAPAYYVGHTDLALPMKNGKPVEEISGHLEHEPANENENLLFKVPLYTYSETFFDSKLPKGAISLIVIGSSFVEGDVRLEGSPLKKRVETEFFPLLPYKEMAELMYK